MKFIRLPHGYVAIVDNEDYEQVKGRSWRAYPQGFYIYAARRERVENGRYQTIYLHHEILGFRPGKGMVVDHRDGNPLNCRRGNLRVCTQGQNNMHHRPRYNKERSRYKGVTYKMVGKHKDRKVWHASIAANKKRYFLGVFDNEHAAVKIYNVWAWRLHGKYAYLNRWEGETKAS